MPAGFLPARGLIYSLFQNPALMLRPPPGAQYLLLSQNREEKQWIGGGPCQCLRLTHGLLHEMSGNSTAKFPGVPRYQAVTELIKFGVQKIAAGAHGPAKQRFSQCVIPQ